MKQVMLTGTGLTVSEFCLGTADVGTAVKGADAERLIGAFLDAGGNFLDTAHCYAFWVPGGGSGSSEREVARCLRALGTRGGEAIVATKGGHPPDGDRYPRSEHYLSPEVVTRDISDSLERLERDCLELFYLHRDDARVPVADVVEMLNAEVRAGRVRCLGASNWSPERVAAANAYAAERGLQGFAVSQVQWSLAVPNWEPGAADPTVRRVTDAAARRYAGAGLPVVAYSANAGGYMAGNERANDLYDNPLSRTRRARARELAAQLGVTPNQVALAWLRHQEPLTIPLFGTTKQENLAEAVGAADIALTPEQVHYLRAEDAPAGPAAAAMS
jgi:Predicted oxidoreductases (related to aryl-alcohol dehydrogenases)